MMFVVTQPFGRRCDTLDGGPDGAMARRDLQRNRSAGIRLDLAMNMRAIVELGVVGPEVERRSGIMFTELIDQILPELIFLGANNSSNFY